MRTLLLLTFIFSLGFNGRSQSYDWPQIGWHQSAIHIGDWTTGFAESNATYWVAGDTTIGSSTFRVLKSAFWKDQWIKYYNGKVYLAEKSDTTYQWLLYDFNAGIGDTIFARSGFSAYCVVDSVGTMMLANGINAKYIRLQSGVEWLEGIGDINGAFNSYADWEGGHEIAVCTYDEDKVQIQSNTNVSYDCDSLIMDAGIVLDVNEITREDLIIHPNPADNIVNIDLSNSYNDILIEVFNLYGQTVYSQNFNNSQNLRLNISKLKSGIYFINLNVDDSTTSTLKLLKK